MDKEVLKHRAASIVVLCFLSTATLAEDSTALEHNAASKPTTTLSAAANAANAAADAASAAADAAHAASAASAAALEAINAILPRSQRVESLVETPEVTPDNVQLAQPNTPMLEDDGAAKLSDNKEAVLLISAGSTAKTGTEQRDFNDRFTAPSERSLVGLIGTFEVSVSADARGDYTSGVQSQNFELVESVSGINLSDAIKESLGFSRDVHVANARMDQAKAQTGQAKAFLLPSLLLNVKTGRENSSPGVEIDSVTGQPESVSNHSRTDSSLTFRQPLLDIPSLYDWKRREIVENSRQESVRSSEGDTYIETVNAYLSLVSARIQVNMAIDYEHQLQELFEYIDKRESAGIATHSDKERVRARSLNAQSARIQQEAAQASAGVEFVRLVNLAPISMRLPELEELGISVLPADVQQAMSLAIASNPDIAVLREELKAAKIDQIAAKGKYLPRFDLELSTNRSEHAGGSDDSQSDQRMMVVMNWSLFNGGGDVKLKQEKIARANELNYRLDDQRRRVLQSVTAQYATLEAIRHRIDTGYSELESISSAAQSMSSRMVSGKQSLLDILDVYNRYFQARTHLVNLHTQEMSAVAQIVRLIQGVPVIEIAKSENNYSAINPVNYR